MSDFRTPISELGVNGPQDAQDGLNMGNVSPQGRRVPDMKNYASDPEIVRRAKEQIYMLIQQTRSDRKNIETGWQQIRRMANMQHDENQKYKGRSNAYLPIHAKNIQAQTTALSRGLFPSDEYLDAQVENNDPEMAQRAKHYMQYQFERISMLRGYMKLFSRQLLDYGFSVLKFWYRKPQPYAKARAKKQTLQGMVSGYQTDFDSDSSDQGLTVSARSIFNFYAYPFTAETLRETTLQFEDIKMSKVELDHWAKVGGWVNPQAIDGAPLPNEIQSDDSLRMSELGLPSNPGSNVGAGLADIRVVTEAYTFMVLPDSEYTESDSKGCPLPVRIVFVGSEPVSIQRNSSYHQSSPYLGLSLNATPGYLLGMGPGQMIAPLQYLTNDFLNQTNDACIYGLNPIVKAVPGLLVGGLRPIAPGVTWYMNDLNAVDFVHPPMEQVGMGLNVAQTLMGMAQDFGGAPPVMQGTGAKGNAKTATGAQILQHNSQQPLQDLVEDIENEVLIPLASKGWLLAQQNAPDRIMASVFGITKEITQDDLAQNATWRWLASSQAANAQTRAFQTTQFLQAILPFVPVLQQQGVQLNVIPVLKRIYTEALGFRGWDELMRPPQPNVMPPQAPGMPGMPPGPGGPPPMAGQAPGSFTDQSSAGPSGLPTQPGEADHGMGVRHSANALAAMLGGMGGGEQ